MKLQKGFTIAEILVMLVILVGGSGWIWNIVKIFHSNFHDITGTLALRLFGILVVPLGAVMGFL